MSSLTVYANEPVTRGKVVVHTSIGPLDIELWPKEAPMACRNFVQLCLEGYYDGCIFHRVIRDFMAQTGDPTGTGKGGESVFGSKFKDEFHSRLRFTHRGLIAMASEGPDTNGSQFFVTLDRCEWLDRKHTIFGKVTGNSLYNLHRFNELEVDAADRPEFAPRIERCEVLLEPFDDIVPRAPAAAPAAAAAAAAATAKPRKKEKRNLNLLSFGEEEAAGEAEAAGQPRALLSSHDVLDDPRLSKKSAIEPSADVPDTAPVDAARSPLPRAPHPPPQRPAGGASDAQDARAADAATDEAAAEAAFEARMLEQMHAKRQRLQPQSAAAASGGAGNGESGGGGSSRAGGGGGGSGGGGGGGGGDAGLSEYDRLKAEMGAERRHELAEAAAESTRRAAGGGGGDAGGAGSGWKWRGKSGGDAEDEDEDEDEDDEGEGGARMSELEKQRARFLQKKRESVGLDRKQREKATLAKLAAFNSRGLSHKLDFRAGQAPKMAEAASSFDSFDPLRHGTHEGRAIQKIREREKAMLSMSGNYADDEPR